MAEDSVQTYASHTRWLAPWHFVVLPVFLINAIVQIVAAVKHPTLATGWAAVLAISFVLVGLFARRMAIVVQDRVIRLEETLRLERLLPGQSHVVEKLSLDHLIGLRFASDSEVPHLVDRILSGELTDAKDVKRAVQHWRADHLRV